MADVNAPAGKYMIDSYLDWSKKEGIPILEDFGLDLLTVKTAPWARLGVNGAIVHVKGRGDCMTVFLVVFHQHFNSGAEPVRYIAFTQGSVRYPMTEHMRRIYAKIDLDVKKGGNQIEYHDQDPRVHRMFVDELARKGITVRMDEFSPAASA